MKQQNESEKILFLFGIGFVLGIIIGNFFLENTDNDTGVMSSYFISKFEYLEINNSQFFFYVFSERSKMFLILAVLGITSIGYFGICAYTLWIGSCIGCFFSICVMRMGFLGLGIGVVSLFPQYLVYIPVYIVLFYTIGKMEEIRKSIKNDKKRRTLVYTGIMLLCMLGLLFGIFLESYVNPCLLKKLLGLL